MKWGTGDRFGRPATHPAYLRKGEGKKRFDENYDKIKDFGKKKEDEHGKSREE